MNVSSVEKGKSVKIGTYVVPDISKVRNEHVEVVKIDYPHLKMFGFQM